MNVHDITLLVNSLGFPIVVAGVLFWVLYKTSMYYNETIDKMRETVDKNTQLIQEMLDHLRGDNKWCSIIKIKQLIYQTLNG